MMLHKIFFIFSSQNGHIFFLYYNSSAMIYALIYGLLSLTGLYIGTLVSRKYGKTDDGKREDYRKKSEGIL